MAIAELYCWGSGALGQDPPVASSEKPLLLRFDDPPKSPVTAGEIAGSNHAICGVSGERSGAPVYCAGSFADASGTPFISLPITEAIPSTFINYISSMGEGFCGNMSAGVYCLGYNDPRYFGLEPDPTFVPPTKITKVNGTWPLMEKVSGLCALTQWKPYPGPWGSDVWCWGPTTQSDGTLPTTAAPRRANLPKLAFDVRSNIIATCAQYEDKHWWCWGLNANGILTRDDGVGASAPFDVGIWDDIQLGELTVPPPPMATGYTGCGIKSGKVWCWGINTAGELGVDPIVVSQSATPLEIAGISDATKISLQNGTVCAVTKDGAVWCWGSNEGLRLGRPATVASSSKPVQIVF
jgi:hypothetical protein